MGETILVTGGAGFVGAYVAKALAERGDKVVCYDLVVPATGSPTEWLLRPVAESVEFVRGDITDLAGLASVVRQKAPVKIVHTAALLDVPTLVNNPVRTLRNVAEGSLNVFEMGRIFDVKRIVYTSSISAYAPKQYEPMDEAHPQILPDEPGMWFYGPGKTAAEAFAQAYWGVFGLDLVGLRLSAVYGFNMRYDMYVRSMVENGVRGLPTKIATGSMRRDYTYVKDVVQGILLALDAVGNRSRLFNVSLGQDPVDVFALAEDVRAVMPEAEIEVSPGFTDLERTDVRTRGRLSLERARQELGFSPEYNLRAGVADYARTLRAYLEGTNQIAR